MVGVVGEMGFPWEAVSSYNGVTMLSFGFCVVPFSGSGIVCPARQSTSLRFFPPYFLLSILSGFYDPKSWPQSPELESVGPLYEPAELVTVCQNANLEHVLAGSCLSASSSSLSFRKRHWTSYCRINVSIGQTILLTPQSGFFLPSETSLHYYL